jgi:hypothetical protein
MTSQAKKVWAAFTTAFFALVALLGFSTPATAAPQAAVTATAAPCKPTAAEARALKALEPVGWWAIPKDRALPPTMKQRICAEAHGSSPSTRHVPLDTDAEDEQQGAAPAADAALRPERQSSLRQSSLRQSSLRQSSPQSSSQQAPQQSSPQRARKQSELQPA